MKTTLIITLLAGTVLAGCATQSFSPSGNGYVSSLGVDLAETWAVQNQAETPPVITTQSAPWLEAFDANEWKMLVEQAFAHNPDLEQLRANLARSDALADQARAGLFPVLDGIAGGSRTDAFEGPNASLAMLTASLSVSWEPDLWGRIGAEVTASEKDREALQYDLNAAQQLLAASVVEAAFLSIEADRLADVSQRNLDALSETLGFVDAQFERGLRSAQDLMLIRADVASATASLRQAEGSVRQAIRALEALIGVYPDTDRRLANRLPAVPVSSIAGKPATVLQTRPDVRAAASRVDAAYARHAMAVADQKPRLALSGSLNGSSARLVDIVDPASMAANLLSNVSAPLFDGGLRAARVKAAQNDIDAALARYKRTAIVAFEEVENQIDQGGVLELREEALSSALEDARQALKFTQFRYESADVDLLNVLQVQQRVSFIEAQLVSLRRARLVQYLNLSLALGVEPFSYEPNSNVAL